MYVFEIAAMVVLRPVWSKLGAITGSYGYGDESKRVSEQASEQVGEVVRSERGASEWMGQVRVRNARDINLKFYHFSIKAGPFKVI